MLADPGSYALILRNSEHATVEVGRRRTLEIIPAFYIYVGSALGPGGVAARVKRHAREHKRLHWHIDYLRQVMEFRFAWYSHQPFNQEHDWARVLSNMPGILPIEGIGCSDCRCPTHLFMCSSEPRLSRFSEQLEEPVECWRPVSENQGDITPAR